MGFFFSRAGRKLTLSSASSSSTFSWRVSSFSPALPVGTSSIVPSMPPETSKSSTTLDWARVSCQLGTVASSHAGARWASSLGPPYGLGRRRLGRAGRGGGGGLATLQVEAQVDGHRLLRHQDDQEQQVQPRRLGGVRLPLAVDLEFVA